MFNTYQKFLEEYSNNDLKITECIDILNDYNFQNTGTQKSRSDYKISNGTFPLSSNVNYEGNNLYYNSDTYVFTYTIPSRPFEFESVSVKAIKTIDSKINLDSANYYNSFITCCSLSSNTQHRIAFNSTNLNDGIDIMPLNQVMSFDFWFVIPDLLVNYNIATLSTLFDNIVIEMDFIVRK